jgi:hypothetical protein
MNELKTEDMIKAIGSKRKHKFTTENTLKVEKGRI